MDKQMAEMARLIITTRDILTNILMVRGRPVKNTTKKECYDCLEKLQGLYKTNAFMSDRVFLNSLFEPKIPEGAVVFTEENMEQTANWIVTHPKMQETMWKLIKAWRKETAEKFAERLKERLDISVNGYSTSEVMSEIEDKIDEIAKEITEGV